MISKEIYCMLGSLSALTTQNETNSCGRVYSCKTHFLNLVFKNKYTLEIGFN